MTNYERRGTNDEVRIAKYELRSTNVEGLTSNFLLQTSNFQLPTSYIVPPTSNQILFPDHTHSPVIAQFNNGRWRIHALFLIQKYDIVHAF